MLPLPTPIAEFSIHVTISVFVIPSDDIPSQSSFLLEIVSNKTSLHRGYTLITPMSPSSSSPNVNATHFFHQCHISVTSHATVSHAGSRSHAAAHYRDFSRYRRSHTLKRASVHHRSRCVEGWGVILVVKGTCTHKRSRRRAIPLIRACKPKRATF